MRFLATIPFIAATLLGFIAVAQTDAMTAPSKESARAKVSESIVIEFAPGTSNLTEESRAILSEAVRTARIKGQIAEVEIAAWSDKEFPLTGALKKADRNLARDRANNTRNELKKELARGEMFKTYNMAEHSNWLGRMFRSSKSELDSQFARHGAAAMKREDFNLIKEHGAPSKVVVVFTIQE